MSITHARGPASVVNTWANALSFVVGSVSLALAADSRVKVLSALCAATKDSSFPTSKES